MRPALLALLLLQLPAISPQQAPRGRVEGVVLRAASDEPVVGARVTLARPDELSSSTNMSNTGSGSSINLFAPPPVPASNVTATTNAPGDPPMPIPPAMTDNTGKFAFSNVPAGTYRLLVTLDGYVRQEYGQRVFPGQGTPLNLSADEVLKDLTFRLTPAGNVSGRLVDNLGKPAVGVPLQLNSNDRPAWPLHPSRRGSRGFQAVRMGESGTQ